MRRWGEKGTAIVLWLTTMNTREPHFFDVCRPIRVGELPFEIV